MCAAQIPRTLSQASTLNWPAAASGVTSAEMCSRAGSADAGTGAPLACSTTSFSSASTACTADIPH